MGLAQFAAAEVGAAHMLKRGIPYISFNLLHLPQIKVNRRLNKSTGFERSTLIGTTGLVEPALRFRMHETNKKTFPD
jgi:hypothetical protein